MGRLILNPSVVHAAPWINCSMEGSKTAKKTGMLCINKSMNNSLCTSVVARIGVTLNVAVANFAWNCCPIIHTWSEHDYSELLCVAECLNRTVFDSLNMCSLITLNFICCRTFQWDHLWLSEHVLAEHLWSVWEQSVSILSHLQPSHCPASSGDSDPDNLFHHSLAALPLGLPVTQTAGIVWLPHESSVGNIVVQLGILIRGSKESWGNLYKPKY